MKDQIIDVLLKNPIAWVAILLLVPFAIKYRYKKFQRAASHANDAKSKSLLVVGFVVAAIIIWAIVQYT